MKRLLLGTVCLLVLSAGCTGLLTGETVSFEADQAGVAASALETTGYQQTTAQTQTLSRDVEVGGQQRQVNITNHITQYAKTVELGPAGSVNASRFIVLTTPGAQVAGQTLNPAASWSNRRIIERVTQQSGQVQNVEFVTNRSARALGQPRDVGVFAGTTTIQGQQVDIRLHVVSFGHEGDLLIAVAIHPEQVDEQDNVNALLAGLQHPLS